MLDFSNKSDEMKDVSSFLGISDIFFLEMIQIWIVSWLHNP